MTYLWQKVGAFVQNLGNLGNSTIDAFLDAGGGWIVVQVYGDNEAAANKSKLNALTDYLHGRAIVGGWYNHLGTADPVATSLAIQQDNLPLVVCDVEKDATGFAPALPPLLTAIRLRRPTVSLGISSYGFADRAFDWSTMWANGARYLPQWYWQYDGRYDPAWCMNDLKTNGHTDPNLNDPKGPHGRGIPLSYVHGTIECTGVEQGNVAEAITRMRNAKQFGFTSGYSLYVLERATPNDLALVKGATDLRA